MERDEIQGKHRKKQRRRRWTYSVEAEVRRGGILRAKALEDEVHLSRGLAPGSPEVNDQRRASRLREASIQLRFLAELLHSRRLHRHSSSSS
jgi:hypothetical protein